MADAPEVPVDSAASVAVALAVLAFIGGILFSERVLSPEDHRGVSRDELFDRGYGVGWDEGRESLCEVLARFADSPYTHHPNYRCP